MRRLVGRVVVDVHARVLQPPQVHDVEEALERPLLVREAVRPQRRVLLAVIDPAEQVVDAPQRRRLAARRHRLGVAADHPRSRRTGRPDRVAAARSAIFGATTSYVGTGGPSAGRLGTARAGARTAGVCRPGSRAAGGPGCAASRRCRGSSPAGAVSAMASASIVGMPAARSRSRCTGRMPATSSRSRDATTSASHVAQRPHATTPSSPRGSPHAIGGPSATEVEAAIGDERGQSFAPQPEDREQVIDRVLADAAVAQQQLDAVGSGDAEPIELVDVRRELHQGRDAGAPGELGVLHDPGPSAAGSSRARAPGSRRTRRSPASRTPPGRSRRHRTRGPRSCGARHRRGPAASDDLTSGISTTRRRTASMYWPQHAASRARCRGGPARSSVRSSGSSTGGTRSSRASMARSHANSHSAAALRSLALHTIRPSSGM